MFNKNVKQDGLTVPNERVSFDKFRSSAVTTHECASPSFVVKMSVERRTGQNGLSGAVEVSWGSGTKIFTGTVQEFIELVDLCHFASGQARIKHPVQR